MAKLGGGCSSFLEVGSFKFVTWRPGSFDLGRYVLVSLKAAASPCSTSFITRAKQAIETDVAPAFSKAFVHASLVAPLVSTSIKTTSRPLIFSMRFALVWIAPDNARSRADLSNPPSMGVGFWRTRPSTSALPHPNFSNSTASRAD